MPKTTASRRDTAERATAERYGFVAVARALLREPDRIDRGGAKDPRTRSLRIHCDTCMPVHQCDTCIPTIYRGTRCVLAVAADRRS